MAAGQNKQLTAEDIAAYAAGIADAVTARRVLAAALQNPAIRQRLTILQAAADEADRFEETAAPAERDADAEPLQSRVADLWPQTSGEAFPPDTAPPLGERMTQVARQAVQMVQATMERVLLTGRQLLTLPCLAPATAAAAPDFTLRRQSVTTDEGVRIEFQQLPGGPPYRVRALVDAGATLVAETAATYDVAYLTLEEAGEPSRGETPNRHVLVIALNDAGRGFRDYVVTAGATTESAVLPAPQAPLFLRSATLARRRQE